jgi:sterol desaturase/sphingolipid hydroxylase (fatty acid hydroxylase superfamily)
VQLILTTAGFCAIIAVRYLATAGAGFWWFWGRRGGAGSRARALNLRPPSRATVRREIAASLIATPIYAFPAAFALEAFKHGQGRLYADPLAYGVWWLPFSALIYIFAQDAYYYWLHRALHHRRVFAWAHRGHHLSRDPTPFASFSFDPVEALLTAWLLPALSFLVPLNLEVALVLLTLMTVTAVINHAGREVWPQAWLEHPIGRCFITASHHDRHHKQFTANFGLYFRFWDQLGGTEKA